MSKPPSETRNTCRLAPSVLLTLITLATIASCAASELPAGGVNVCPPCSAADNVAYESSERALTLTVSFSNRWVRFLVSTLRNAVEPAADPNSVGAPAVSR